jgi:hypothetical protein
VCLVTGSPARDHQREVIVAVDVAVTALAPQCAHPTLPTFPVANQNKSIFLSRSHTIPVGLATLLPLFHFSSDPSRGLYQVTIIPPPPTPYYTCTPPSRFRLSELRNCRRAAGTVCAESDYTRTQCRHIALRTTAKKLEFLVEPNLMAVVR